LALPLPAQTADIEKGVWAEVIATQIRRHIIEPCSGINPGLVHLDITLDDDGYVSSITVKKRSAVRAWDKAVMQAISAAQPLIIPANVSLRKDFQELNLRFHPGKVLPPCAR
jgi:TonB family protein